MATKVTFFFSCGRYSWSESHIMTVSGPPTSFQAQAIQYAQLRVPCLGNGAELTNIRLSEVPANRLFDDVNENLFPSVPTWPADPTGLQYTADRPYSALLVKMKSGLLVRPWYIAGVPDGFIDQNVNVDTGINWSGAPAFQDRILALLNYLTGGAGWGYLSNSATALTQAVGPPVTLAQYPGQVGIQTAAALAGVVNGSQVLLRGWRRNNVRLQGLSGFYQVASVVPPTSPATTPYTYMLSRTGNVSPTNFETVGRIGLAAPLPNLYTDYGFVRAVKRSRGGSYGLPHGRSRTSA